MMESDFGTIQIDVPDGDSLSDIFNNKADNVVVDLVQQHLM